MLACRNAILPEKTNCFPYYAAFPARHALILYIPYRYSLPYSDQVTSWHGNLCFTSIPAIQNW